MFLSNKLTLAHSLKTSLISTSTHTIYLELAKRLEILFPSARYLEEIERPAPDGWGD